MVLDNVTLVTPGIGRIAHRRLTVRGDRIGAVETAARKGEPERYVLPGLIDMHTHLPPRFVPGLVDLFDLLFLAHGVTTIREVGSIDGQVFEIANEVELGERVGPRIVGCGPILDGEPPTWPVARVTRSRDEGEAVARELAERGARCVKTYEGISADALSGVRSAAGSLGLPVLGHVPSAFALSEHSLDDVQHLCYTRCSSVSPEEIEAFIEDSARRDVTHTPTLVVFLGQLRLGSSETQSETSIDALMPRFWRDTLWRPIALHPNADVLASMQELVRRLHARGVRINVGTDPIQPFVVPGASLHRELALLVESGLSIEEALAAATWVAGESLGIERLGRLEVGAPADLLVLREDPSRDLAALETIEAVIADGRLYPIEVLREALDDQRSYFERRAVDLPLRAVARLGVEVARRSLASADGESP